MFKKLFLILIYQNDLKTYKKLIFSKNKNLKFERMRYPNRLYVLGSV